MVANSPAFGPQVIAAAAVAVLFALFSANALLTILVLLVLLLLLAALWRPHEPPILMFVAGYQWLQVSTKVLHADVLGIDVGELQQFGNDIELAIVLSSAALLMLAAGMWVALRRNPSGELDKLLNEARNYSASGIWLGYLVAFGIGAILTALAWLSPGLTQLLLSIASLRILFLSALVYVAFATGREYIYVVAAIALELVIGLSGFFGEFKTALYVLIIMSAAAIPRISNKHVLLLLTFVAFGVGLSIFWTSIKGDYRDFINEGTGQQVVVVPWGERMEEMILLALNLDVSALMDGVDALLNRMSYVDFFAAALNYVPSVQEHTRGIFVSEALVHVLTPRLLFPEKSPLWDNEVVLRYTGIEVAPSGSGTSIGLGYVGELYVDFGIVGMLLAVFVMGYLAGCVYRFLLRNDDLPHFMRYGLALVVLLPMSAFEISLVKIVGGVTLMLLVSVMLRYFGLGKLMKRFQVAPQVAPV